MLSIAICDDEPLIAHQMESILLEIEKNNFIKIDEIDVFYSANELETSLCTGTIYDIIYLDIKMPKINGIEIAQVIRRYCSKTLFIFVSSYEQYWRELFEVEAFRFLSKPIDKQLFYKYFLAAIDKIKKNDAFFDFTYKHHVYRIPINNIIYFESNGRYIAIHLLDGTLQEFRGKLDDIEDKINNNDIHFLRIHQSYFINYQHILCMSRSQVQLINKTKLPISYEKQKSVRMIFTALLGGLYEQ